MQGTIRSQPEVRGELTIVDLWRLLRPHFALLVVGFFGGAVLGYVSAALARPMYEASLIMAPAGNTAGSSALQGLGQLGGLAALAGISMPEADRRTEFLEVLRSRSFASDFLSHHDLLDTIKTEMRGLVSRLRNTSISDSGAIDAFRRQIMRIEEDRRSGIIRLTVRWHDPEVAAEWTNNLASSINRTLRERAVDDAAKMVKYLENQIARAESVPVRQALYSALESELKSEAIARVREDYAYRVLDPAVPPNEDEAVSPNLGLRLLGGALLGTLMALAFVVLRHVRRAARAEDGRAAAA